ncbi:hypothetical protein PtrSN002B_005662 [Pyrenophora tritici-repentis]|nr:hypothetical protein Alg215_04281 [Pyrenophora tritici-repentis]KAI0585572.1 hypothetical protein Alg130_04677 [Pyrenophora tritici-repentis]KAI0611142.1 hypothetical protein TUN205_04606 [Pyrenophora tritici-repentis]KAI0623135.1 hypothetical protein TUN199_04862 [Pyrenophora tritici-repentis]KAI1536571.1 hypothetical protein PtrSN001A_005586 [Pyrenophora tritici-repentis]
MARSELMTIGAAGAALGGAYKLAEFLTKAKRVRDVGPSNAVYVRIIGRVRSDLEEVRRLLSVREIHDILEANPEKSKWVYGCMRDVRGALENMTPLTERVAGDVEDGRRIGIRHRVYWVMSEKEKLENREKELNIAHNSLAEVLVWIERDGAPKQHFEEHRDVYVERDRQPPAHYEEHRDVYIDERHRGPAPQHLDERGHGPRYEPSHAHWEQHGRDHRDARYETHYDERYEQEDHYRSEYPIQTQDRYNQARPFPEPLGRRPDSFERQGQYSTHGGQYAEYGAPQPIGAASYSRKFKGDAGFGDEEILNPQPVPLDRKYTEREVSGYNAGYNPRFGSKL